LIHAQHQCEIEIVSGVHHIEHNVEQKKGVLSAFWQCLHVVMESSSNSYLVARTKNSRPGPSSAKAVQEMGRSAGALGKLEAGWFHHDSQPRWQIYAAVQLLDFKNVAQRADFDINTPPILSPAGVVTKKMLQLGVCVWFSLRATLFSTFTGHNNGMVK